MKYKIGDKVKVREDLIEYKEYTNDNDYSGDICPTNFSMCKYSGAIVTISDIVCRAHGYRYKISEDNHEWNWVDGMFEGLASKVENKKNIKEKTTKTMKDFKIKDYKVYEDTALIVEFEDGTKEKAVANEEDRFDLERGVEICVLKHLYGVDGYKSMVKKAMNQIKAVDKAKEDKKKEEELIARKKAKAARKKARRLERKRKERIAEMKEAYLAAMNEHDRHNISAALDDILNGFDDFK